MSDDEAVEIARKVVARHGDGKSLQAKAALCRYTGYDEDGDVAEYEAFVLASAYLRSVSFSGSA